MSEKQQKDLIRIYACICNDYVFSFMQKQKIMRKKVAEDESMLDIFCQLDRV